MKRNIRVILLLLIQTGVVMATTPTRVMTFNIRYNNPQDGPNAWPHRIEMVASMIRFHKADIVGLQEALLGQLNDLQEQLPEYTWFGAGRDDGDKKGEFSAILYKPADFELLKQSTFWLSETPNTPGKGWDAMLPRVVTWGRFRHKESKNIFYIFNTHFDHRGEMARRESAKLLVRKVSEIAEDSPFVVTGDFNSDPDSKPYDIITNKLVDSRKVSRQPPHGPVSTSTGFRNIDPERQPIDYVFVKPGLQVLSHGTLSDTMHGRFPSDHLPVIAEILIE
jgi:endonuclease/exonuclease/phosphatase family metal-dependent hydrolase